MFKIMIVVALFAIAFAIIFATLKICKALKKHSDSLSNSILDATSKTERAYRDSQKIRLIY